ncbi:rod shape-determining protein MreD [Anaerotalea alkaliphila]|uniref:Rod shape-determining protein MreD n=1 Tax=Anaerotalea alkaliphila TaxID=2662126 RepID=A0A7X5KNE6_9FIRM|nr:rod shape-determining protein MreD [Anaerotalea alkaliphila]NDL67949.1 rod shape-determining protein MreD [Anaerotalea alkaliphila]
MRMLVMGILLVLNIVFQSTLSPAIAINGVVPNFMMVTIVSFAILRGRVEGALIGLVFGLTQDILFGDVIGFYLLLYFYAGFLCGHLNRAFYRESIMIPLVMVGISEFLFNMLVYVSTFLFRGKVDFAVYLFYTIIPVVTYTTLAAVILYRLYIILNLKLEAHEHRERDFKT